MGDLTAGFLSGSGRALEQHKKQYPYTILLTVEEYNDLIDCEVDGWPQVSLWMQEECEGKILVVWGFFSVWFELESDLVAFKLRWI